MHTRHNQAVDHTRREEKKFFDSDLGMMPLEALDLKKSSNRSGWRSLPNGFIQVSYCTHGGFCSLHKMKRYRTIKGLRALGREGHCVACTQTSIGLSGLRLKVPCSQRGAFGLGWPTAQSPSAKPPSKDHGSISAATSLLGVTLLSSWLPGPSWDGDSVAVAGAVRSGAAGDRAKSGAGIACSALCRTSRSQIRGPMTLISAAKLAESSYAGTSLNLSCHEPPHNYLSGCLAQSRGQFR